MDDNLGTIPDHERRAIQLAVACFLLAGGRDDRDLRFLLLLGQETYLRMQDKARLTMRQLVPASRMTLRSLFDTIDRLTRDGLVIRDREPGATGASFYSINLPRLIEAAEAYDDARQGVVVLPAAWAKPDTVPVVRKRTRRAA